MARIHLAVTEHWSEGKTSQIRPELSDAPLALLATTGKKKFPSLPTVAQVGGPVTHL